MQALEYPFDAAMILQKKRSLKRELSTKTGLVDKKVAILSGSTIGEIKNILELFLLDAGIRPTFYVGGYALYYENLVFDDGSLASFAPDIIYIHTSAKNMMNLPLGADSTQAIEDKFAAESARWRTVWDAAAKFGCPIIANNFEQPPYRLMGNMLSLIHI